MVVETDGDGLVLYPDEERDMVKCERLGWKEEVERKRRSRNRCKKRRRSR